MKYLLEKSLSKIVFVLLLFGCQYTHAQLLIPFRSGHLWGVVDTLGNVKVKPAYDAVLFGDENKNLSKADFPQGYFLVKKNGKYGVLQNKEILPPVYDHIYCIDRSYFIVETNRGTPSEKDDFFTLEGKPFMPAGYQLLQAVWKYYGNDEDMRQPTYIVFSFRDSANREGLFCYNFTAPKRSGILIRDYATLRQVSMRNQQLTIRAKKHLDQENEFILIGYHPQQKNVVVLERNGTGDFNAEKYKKLTDDNYGTSIAPEAEMDERTRPVMKLEVVEAGSFRIENNTVSIDIQTKYNSKKQEDAGKKYTQQFALPADAGSVSIADYKALGTFRHQLKSGDTTREFKSFVRYQQNGKTGFIASGKIVAAIYDSVTGFSINAQPNQSGICFMAGIRDQAGILHFGIVDAEGNSIIPMIYQSMQYRNDLFSSTMKYGGGKWLVKKDNHYGLITADNKTLLQPQYDTIQLISRYSNAPVFTLLKKDNLYGAYYLENDGLYTSTLPPVLIAPFSKYPIAELLFLPRTKSPDRNYFTLLLLANEQGEAIGYAGKSGMNYFKD